MISLLKYALNTYWVPGTGEGGSMGVGYCRSIGSSPRAISNIRKKFLSSALRQKWNFKSCVWIDAGFCGNPQGQEGNSYSAAPCEVPRMTIPRSPKFQR